jgi:hypothetical protein
MLSAHRAVKGMYGLLADYMSRFIPSLLAGLAAAALGGCATMLDSTQQQLEVHTIVDNREVAGVGCVLTNDAGRWFVVAPGRLTIDRSAGALSVDCARQGVGSARAFVGSRFDTGKLIGNLVVSGGLGYLVDRRSGAGFAYPATLTVIMQRADLASVEQQGGALDNRMF